MIKYGEGSPNPLANKDSHRPIFTTGHGLPGPYSLADLDRGGGPFWQGSKSAGTLGIPSGPSALSGPKALNAKKTSISDMVSSSSSKLGSLFSFVPSRKKATQEEMSLLFRSASTNYTTVPLSYTITGGSARHKKWPQNLADFRAIWRHFHDNWFLQLMELPLTRLNSEPATIFNPLVLAKRFFLLFDVFAINCRCLYKDWKVMHVILTRERQPKPIWKPRGI